LAGNASRFRAGWWVLPLVVPIVVALDRYTKSWVVSNLGLYESWKPIPALGKVLEIHYITNTGVAFGLFQGGGFIFKLLPIVISSVILYYYMTLPAGQWLIRLALGLQMAGALGNLIDRLFIGHVIDFIHVPYWPVFNVADSAITTGTVLLVLLLLREEWRERKAAQQVSEGTEGVGESAPSR
jgi:signal peptidase II